MASPKAIHSSSLSNKGKRKVSEARLTSSITLDLNLRVICEELGSVSHKAIAIGIQLGISLGTLKKFKEEDVLPEAVDYWLKGNAKDKGVPISWHSVVRALDNAQVDEAGLAEKICKKYCHKIERGQCS